MKTSRVQLDLWLKALVGY